MIDQLVEALTAGTGVTFVRDAWKNMPSTDYGVVDVASSEALWADDKQIEQAPLVNVWLYTHDHTGVTAGKVRTALNGFDGSMGFTMAVR